MQTQKQINHREEAHIATVRENGYLIREIPEDERTESVCIAAVQQNGMALRMIREEKRTEAVCKAAVQQNGMALAYVMNRTEEICKDAIEQNVDAVRHIPEKIKRTEAIQSIIRLADSVKADGLNLRNIPESQRSVGICVAAFKQNSLALQYIPEVMRTEAFYIEILLHDPLALQYIPENKRSEAIYNLIYLPDLEKGILRVTDIPIERRTERIYIVALNRRNLAFQDIPLEKRSERIYRLALEKGIITFKDVPPDKYSEENFMFALEKGILTFKDIPPNKRTEKIHTFAFNLIFKDTPLEKRSEENYVTALKQGILELQDIPEDKRTNAFYITAVKQNVLALKDVPESTLTETFYLTALKEGILEFQDIPENKRTETIYLTVLKEGILEFQDIPEDKRTNKIILEEKHLFTLIQDIADQLLKESSRLMDDFKNYQDTPSSGKDLDKYEKYLLIWKENINKILFDPDYKNPMTWRLFDTILKKFNTDHPGEKTEIVLFFDDDLDADLAKVVEMLSIQSTEKNKHYLMLPYSMVKSLVRFSATNNIICESKLDKISFLHHWSTDHTDKEVDQKANEAASIIQKITNIDQIVLRGCSTAGIIKDNIFSPKQIKIVSSKKNIDDEPLEFESNQFLFQQIVEESGNVKTKVRYYDINKEIITQEIPNIPYNKSGNKLSPEVEKALAISSKKNTLPLLDFTSKEMKKLIIDIRQDWLRGNRISLENKNIMKATDKHTRTFIVSEFPNQKSMARKIKIKLEENGRRIVIKSYGGPYGGYPAGAMGEESHGHTHLPKALKLK